MVSEFFAFFFSSERVFLDVSCSSSHMVNASAAVAQTLRGLLPLQVQYDTMQENFHTISGMYNVEKEKRIRLEELNRVRADYKEHESRYEIAESSRQGGQRALENAEKAKAVVEALAERRHQGVRALSKQFKKTIDMLKEESSGTRAQVVRDFLSSGSFCSLR